VVLSNVLTAGLAVVVTSCPMRGVLLRVEPHSTTAEWPAPTLAYLTRAATRHRMTPIFQADLACRQAWRAAGNKRGRFARNPDLIVCSDYREVGPIDVSLYYAGSWEDSTSTAVQIRRELTDSLARFGVLTVSDSVPSLLTR
jgi:hypothetical protein